MSGTEGMEGNVHTSRAWKGNGVADVLPSLLTFLHRNSPEPIQRETFCR